MFAYLPLQSPLFIFIPLLIVIILAVLVIVFVLTERLQLLRSCMQPRILSIQTAHEQEGVREQLESTAQQLVESQQQLEETHRQLADTRNQLEERRRQQEEALEQLAITREQLEDSRMQLVETQERLKAAEEQLRAAQGKPSKGTSIGDGLLNNKAWIKLTEECVSLFDELDRKSATMDARRQELAGYVCSQLEEILERCGVTIISGDSAFDERRHRPYPAVSRVATGTVIAETLSPGFVVGPRVLRRARVRLAVETE
jgi:molecular chaperone GrpE (heat shock protein)